MSEPTEPTEDHDADLAPSGRRWAVRFRREYDHPVQRVWRALTSAEEVRRWAPYDPERDLDSPGELATPEVGDPASTTRSRVTEVRAPHVLELLWDTDRVRWELEDLGGRTAVTLLHEFDDRTSAADYAGGWHVCLAGLGPSLDGRPFTTGAGDRDRGTVAAAAYVERFGLTAGTPGA